jgi:hypothetical protein
MKSFLLLLILLIFFYPFVYTARQARSAGGYNTHARNADPIQVIGVAHAASSRAKIKREGSARMEGAVMASDARSAPSAEPGKDNDAVDAAKINAIEIMRSYFLVTLSTFLLICALALARKDLGYYILGHGGLRFITILLILMALVVFGVTKILGAKEISALLGTIAGYILGAGRSGDFGTSRPESPGPASDPAAIRQAS